MCLSTQQTHNISPDVEDRVSVLGAETPLSAANSNILGHLNTETSNSCCCFAERCPSISGPQKVLRLCRPQTSFLHLAPASLSCSSVCRKSWLLAATFTPGWRPGPVTTGPQCRDGHLDPPQPLPRPGEEPSTRRWEPAGTSQRASS